jgi:tetratricopeptide (TPR) repeat protein
VLESVLSSVGAFTQPWMQQRAHCSVANLAQRRGDLEVARAHAKHGLVLARRNEDSLGAAQALLLLGLIAADAGHPVRSEVLLLRALRLFEGRGDDRGVRVTLGLVAFLFMAQGRYAEAADSAARALELARVGNDGATTALAAGNLAHVRIKESRYEEALRLLDESLSITVSRGDVQGIAETLLDVAEMAIVVGAYESAHHFLQAIPVLAESVQFSLTPVEREWLDEMSDRVQKARGPVAPETRTDAATTTEAISEDAIRFIRSQLAEQTRPGGIW